MSRLGAIQSGGGIPASALGTPLPSSLPSKLSAAKGSMVRGERVTLPLLGPAYLRVVGAMEDERIEADTLAAMAASGIPMTPGFAFIIDQARKRHCLAVAVRDPDDPSIPFGSLEEWSSLDNDVIFAAGLVYEDMRNRLDPLGSKLILTDEKREEIMKAFEKKNRTLLMYFGIAELAAWLASTELQPASSPIPTSTDTESSPES